MIIDFHAKTQPKAKKGKADASSASATMQKAKEHGNKEIGELRDALTIFRNSTKNLAIVEATEFEDAIGVMIESTIDGLYVPLINSGHVKEMSDAAYNSIRLQIFSALIRKYNINIDK